MSNRHRTGICQRLVITGLVLLISACVSGPGYQAKGVRDQLRNAGDFYNSGEWSQAADLFERSAEQQQQPGFSQSMLRAADARTLAQQWQQARLDTSRISESVLRSSELAWLQFLRAELAMRRGDLESAEMLLMQLAALPKQLFPRLEILSRRLELQKRAPESLALARFRQKIVTTDSTDAGEIATAIHLLDTVSNSRLSQMRAYSSDDPLLGGWLDLARIIRTHLFTREQLPESLADWKSIYADHPLSEGLALRVARRYAGIFRPPQNIAVFLPVDGRFATAAAAIRDGMVNAYLESASAWQSTLRFYPVNGPGHVARAYIDAREDGVDWIIGPLDKDSVQAMLELPGFNIPALLLNQANDLSRVDLAQIDQLFSYALLPEDEARQMAELAVLQGLTTAAVLAPDTSWGSRVAEAFSTHFAAAGGEVLQDSRYSSQLTDHSPVLRHMLKIDDSESRHKALQSILRQPLGFQAQRRRDLDVIFLAARPRQGRLLKPQLRFFDAGEIPVYATSQLYSGKPDNRADRDLNNISLPLSPIQLERSLHAQLSPESSEAPSRRQGRMDGFFGLGFDAIGLLPYLELLTYNPGLTYPGESGQLSVANQGRIERTLEWVRFRNGRIQTWDPF